MKRALLLLAFFASSCSRSADDEGPKLSTITIIDSNGFTETLSSKDRLQQYERVDFSEPQSYQKVLRVYSRNSQGNVPAILTSYHTNGQLKQYLEAQNNSASGVYKEWYPSGAFKLEAHVINGMADLSETAEKTWLFDGVSHVFEESGSLTALIQYKKGVLDGSSLYYHPSGSIWKRVPYEQGFLNGTFEVYLENGQLLQTFQYKNGAKQGIAKRFWPDGSVAAVEEYDNDLLMTAKYTDLKGQEVAHIINGNGYRPLFSVDRVAELQEYSKGIQSGEVQIFDAEGNLINKHQIKTGVKHGQEIEYHVDRFTHTVKPKLSLTWFNGTIQGLVKTWYDNGVLESQREMSQNKKDGLATAWYQDGSLMMIEDYKQDILVRGEYYKLGEKIPVSQVFEGAGTSTLFDAEGNFSKRITYHNGKPQE